ncbi:uncharacterized protein LOC111830469 [Capsella rubella]|uniref:uncharacterized protein LOC111830469 n=1 Tax=Capsella rubella TaxID=81985 RepID=UPI000CD4E9EE|nr:uncharacterized protein LOC111830469 [Capsella rubella]
MALIIRGGEQRDFAEDGQDQDEFHIDKLAQDSYPENDDEKEGRPRGTDRVFSDIGCGDGTMWEDKSFYNGIAFKDCVLDYALHTGYNLKQYMYDKDKLLFRCVGEKGKCEWKVESVSNSAVAVGTKRENKIL